MVPVVFWARSGRAVAAASDQVGPSQKLVGSGTVELDTAILEERRR